jgi:GMP synthase (glutamine-hydrolysing)
MAESSLYTIRHQPSAPLGIAEEVIAQHRIRHAYIDAWRDRKWPEVSQIAGLIVLGGGMNVDEVDDYPFLQRSRDLIVEALERQIPVLGICLGAQMLARALEAEVKPSPVREIGFYKLMPTPAAKRDAVASAFVDVDRLFQWHEDAFDFPEGAELLFSGVEVPNQAFRYGENAYGIQFHFEVRKQEIAAWCDETDPSELAEVWQASKQELLEQARRFLPAQHRAGRRAMSNFIDLAGGPPHAE